MVLSIMHFDNKYPRFGNDKNIISFIETHPSRYLSHFLLVGLETNVGVIAAWAVPSIVTSSLSVRLPLSVSSIHGLLQLRSSSY